jgi:hypothetical protein
MLFQRLQLAWFLVSLFFLFGNVVTSFLVVPKTTTTRMIPVPRQGNPYYFPQLRAAAPFQNPNKEEEEKNKDDNETTPFSDDPRAFQRKQRQEIFNKMKNQQQQQRERIQKVRLGEQASKSMDLPKQPLITTIAGGTSAIFAMARRMATATTTTTITKTTIPSETTNDSKLDTSHRKQVQLQRPPPRWNSQQYAASIWKNARQKYNKPAMWKHALRTFDRMQLQLQPGDPSTTTPKPQTIHYEGALAACAKLGDSKRALQIYQTILAAQNNINNPMNPDPKESRKRSSTTTSASMGMNNSNSNSNSNNSPASVHVTENMIHSVIRACVRDAKRQSTREPLDHAIAIVQSMTDLHQIDVTATHVNPLAAAYLDLGYVDTAETLLRTLPDRIGGPEAENPTPDGNFAGFFNVHDVTAKDKGSYALLVEAAISRGNYGDAVDALINMTEKSGLYAESRHLSIWHERSSSKSR